MNNMVENKKPQSLVSIEEELLEVLNIIEENDGEVTKELEEALQISRDKLQNKSINYVKIIDLLEAEKVRHERNLERLKAKSNLLDKGIDRLKSSLLQALLLFGEKDKPTSAQVKSGLSGTKRLELQKGDFIARLSNRQNKKIDIADEAIIDEKYKKFTINNLNHEDYLKVMNVLKPNIPDHTEVVSKTLIKEDIEEKRVNVYGASLVVSHSLNIK